MSLQDLPFDILLDIARLHPWVSCELSKTVRKVGIYSLEHDMQKWFKIEENKMTFILAKSSKNPSYYEKLRHSWNDKPAFISPDGGQYWYKEGKLHSDNDKPAVIHLDGTQMWYKDGKQHRENDKPAVISPDTTHIGERVHSRSKTWYKEGLLHQDNDKPAVIDSNGSQHWYKEGKKHRDGDLPAVIYPGYYQWWYKEDEQYYPKIELTSTSELL